jgi:hypothetical protein
VTDVVLGRLSRRPVAGAAPFVRTAVQAPRETKKTFLGRADAAPISIAATSIYMMNIPAITACYGASFQREGGRLLAQKTLPLDGLCCQTRNRGRVDRHRMKRIACTDTAPSVRFIQSARIGFPKGGFWLSGKHKPQKHKPYDKNKGKKTSDLHGCLHTVAEPGLAKSFPSSSYNSSKIQLCEKFSSPFQ